MMMRCRFEWLSEGAFHDHQCAMAGEHPDHVCACGAMVTAAQLNELQRYFRPVTGPELARLRAVHGDNVS